MSEVHEMIAEQNVAEAEEIMDEVTKQALKTHKDLEMYKQYVSASMKSDPNKEVEGFSEFVNPQI